MTNNADITEGWSTVVEAVATRDRDQGTWSLLVYNADESRAGSFDIDAVSERGALLEATAWLKKLGWDPTGRWDSDADDHYGDHPPEAVRTFRRNAGDPSA